MRYANTKRKGRPARRAFTLAEVLVCAGILSLVFVSLLAALGHESEAVQSGADTTAATFLAEEIRDMALRMDFQDVLALDGTVYDPAVLSTGVAQAQTEFSQVISVVPVDAEDLSATVSPGDAKAAHLVVMVRARGKQAMIQDFYIFDLSDIHYLQR